MTDLPPRSTWCRCLDQHDTATLSTTAERLTAGCTVRHRQLPQAGLGMLRLREPSLGERFNLGEFPLTVVAVDIVAADGGEHAGAATIMDDDIERATAMAVLDAIAANRLPAWSTVADLLRTGAERAAREDRIRAGILHRTSVDFTPLESDDGDRD